MLKDFNLSYVIHVKRREHGPNVGIGRLRQIPQAKKQLELVEGEKSRRALGHEFPVPLMTLTRL